MNVWDVIIALIRYEICGVELSDCEKKSITSADFNEIYRCSKYHEIAHVVGESLKKNGFLSAENQKAVSAEFEKERLLALMWHSQSQYEIDRISSALEKHAVKYLPLKGVVQRELYKTPWYRTSCDLDFLVEEKDLDRAMSILKEELEYTVGERTANEQSLQSPSGIHLELHYDMTERGQFTNDVLTNIWDYTTDYSAENHYRKKLIPSAYYYCHVQHMMKHFRNGGCGIRTLIDLWILKNNTTCRDFDDDSLVKDSECSAFYDAIDYLLRVWFNKEEPNDLSLWMQDFIFAGGVYGSKSNVVKIGQTKKGGRFKYLLSRVFISNKDLKEKYPVLKEKPILIPFYHIKRWFRPIFIKSSAKSAAQDLSYTVKTDSKTLKRREEMFKRIGILD